MKYKLKDNHLELWELLLLCCKCSLKPRQIKYILWNFACDKTYREIAMLDDVNNFQSVDQVITSAKRKIIKYKSIDK
jgi:hypothetical protein